MARARGEVKGIVWSARAPSYPSFHAMFGLIQLEEGYNVLTSTSSCSLSGPFFIATLEGLMEEEGPTSSPPGIPTEDSSVTESFCWREWRVGWDRGMGVAPLCSTGRVMVGRDDGRQLWGEDALGGRQASVSSARP